MTAPEGCPEPVIRRITAFRSRREPCGKPIKRRGKCGVHAAVLDRNDARRAESARLDDARRATRKLATKAQNLRTMLAAVGVQCSNSNWDPFVRLHPDEAEKLLKRLQAGA